MKKITADFRSQDVQAFDLSEYETFTLPIEGKEMLIVRSRLAGMTPGPRPPSNISSGRRRRKQHKTHLRLEQKKAAVLYAKTHSFKEAAAKFGVHSDSIRNWHLGRSLRSANTGNGNARSRKAS